MSDHAIPIITSVGKKPASSKADIGDAWIEGREHCAKPGAGCFLDPQTRSRLVGAYQMRVMGAADAFYSALGALQLGEALKKEEDVDLFTALVIDALGTVASSALKRAAKWVRSANAGAVVGAIGAPAEAHDDAKSADENAIGFAIKGAIDSAKKGLKAQAQDGSEFDRDKAAVSSFTDQLGNNAALAFQRQREEPPGILGDAELITAYHSWSADMGHNRGTYLAELQAKVSRFRASPASKIGRTDRHVHGPSWEAAMKEGPAGIARKGGDHATRDTKLVLHTYADGSPSMLLYYVKDYQLPVGSTTDHEVDLEPFALGDWQPASVVEPEFAEAATTANRDKWKRDYEVKNLDAPGGGYAAYTDPNKRPKLPEPSKPTTPYVYPGPRHKK